MRRCLCNSTESIPRNEYHLSRLKSSIAKEDGEAIGAKHRKESQRRSRRRIEKNGAPQDPLRSSVTPAVSVLW